MTLESDIYSKIYKGYENDKNGSVVRKNLKFDKLSTLALSAGTVGFATFSANYFNQSQDMSISEFLLPCMISLTGASLATHYYQLWKCNGRIFRKQRGEVVSEEEIPKLCKRVGIGRSAHRIGSALGSMILLYLVARKNPVLGGLLAGAEYFILKENIWKGYRGFYSAIQDSMIKQGRKVVGGGKK